MKVWSYVITTDRGSAPNYDDPAVTLTICKPYIRRHARPGDLVLAFNGATLARGKPHSVRWAGVVGEVIPLEKYWDDRRFEVKKPGNSATPDNIYRIIDGLWVQEPNASHWVGDTPNDISGINALVFARAWYMGELAPELPEPFGLRVYARRAVPCRNIESDEQKALTAWLNDNHRGLSDQATKSASCSRQVRSKAASTCSAAI